MRIKYNAPVSLTFSLICVVVLAIDQFLMPGITRGLFTSEGNLTFDFTFIPSYIRLFTHVLGHKDWQHLLNNLTLILLLGPILEEKHGPFKLFLMILVTAVANGLINAIFFPTELSGGSGIVFMMILLVSFVNVKKGEIPLTFIIIVGLYLAKEIMAAFQLDDISRISHIVGGVCGSLFGFFSGSKARGKQPISQDPKNPLVF